MAHNYLSGTNENGEKLYYIRDGYYNYWDGEEWQKGYKEYTKSEAEKELEKIPKCGKYITLEPAPCGWVL